LYPELRI